MTTAEDWPQQLRLSPLPEFDSRPPLTPQGRDVIRRFADRCNDYILRLRQKHGPQGWAHKARLLTGQDIDYLCDSTSNLFYREGEFRTPIETDHVAIEASNLLTESHHLEPVQLVRLLVALNQVTSRFVHCGARQVLDAYRKARRGLGLRELGAVLELIGVSPRVIAREYLDNPQPVFRWGCDVTWPYFVEHLDALAWALSGRRMQAVSYRMRSTNPDGSDRDQMMSLEEDPACCGNALDAIECFPRVPPPLWEPLFEIALGSAKTFRHRAQNVCGREPDCVARVLDALGGRKSATRAIAARWLGCLGRPDAIEPLRKALRKERHDAARSAVMDALARLGVSEQGELDHRQLAVEAAQKLAQRGLPPEVAWVPFEQLPVLKWRGSGQEVPKDVLTWWLVQAHKTKSPEPGFELRRQLQFVEPADREALGEALLGAWIDFDTMPPTMEQARKAAERSLGRITRVGEWRDQLAAGAPTLEEMGLAVPERSELIEHFMNQSAGSAIQCKGLLAVCAASGGEATATKAAEFIRKWYGLRAAQSKALVRMISWIEHPTAVQFLTSTAKRFRTRGIRDEAHRAMQALAERRGWTVDEFADRMIPDAGLDEQGHLFLDFGSRRFVAEMDPGFRFHVRADDGTLRSELPKPGNNDDESKAIEARRVFTKAKKQVRDVVKEQTDRLFGAMCSERRWELGDWRDTLARHPIVGVLCRRLVWRAESGETDRLFRPRGGLDLVDARSAPLALPSATRVRIAHDHNTPPEQAMPWIEHLRSYAIEPLFPQLNRGLPRLDDSMRQGDSIDDFRGFLLTGYTLRNEAKRLGYFRGEALDGLQFFHYYKPYPGLGVEVHIEFSGNEIPESDDLVALERMVFQKTQDPGSVGRPFTRLPLAEVPPILLLESFRDLRQVAEAGEGFDPEWEQRVWR